MSDENNTVFVVFGLRHDPQGVKDAKNVEVETLGVLHTLEDAVMLRDLYTDLDTSLDAVTISTSSSYHAVPDMDIFIRLSFFDQSLILNSYIADGKTEAYLIDEGDRFECLAYPEDEDAMIQRALAWYSHTHGKDVKQVIDMVPEDARLLISHN